MASVIRKQSKTGVRYDIQLSPSEHPDRPKIALGKVTKSDAQTIKMHIQRLVRHKLGAELTTATQEWLAGVPDSLRSRLETLELVESQSKGETYTVESWCKKYIAMRKKDKKTKPDTLRKFENVANRLSLFFKDTALDGVNTLEAKVFKDYLTGTAELSENTARKHIAISRQFYNAAIDGRLISENPFRGQSVAVRVNNERFFYVTPEIAQAVLDACPNAQWRLIFGLARFGGLRCPSEVLRLQWQDIDFANDRFTVHASKTEHHADGGIRTVPMFPELKPLFQDAFEQAAPGTVYCITQYRDKGVNLRTQLGKIIKRAGLKPWPKLFQNCRSTRETELFKLTGGNVKAVCSWIGNSPAVAMQHYAQVTEADMEQAAKLTVLKDAEKRVHNRVQTVAVRAEMKGRDSQEEKQGEDATLIEAVLYEQMKKGASLCETPQMGGTGLEPVTSRV